MTTALYGIKGKFQNFLELAKYDFDRLVTWSDVSFLV